MFKSKMTGKQKIFNQLRRVSPNMNRDLSDSLGQSTKEFADLARSFAPKDSGDYSRSIVAKKAKDKKNPKIPRWGLYASWIWRFVEFGTQAATKGKRVSVDTSRKTNRKSGRTHPGTPARPHIFPAWRTIRKRIKSRTTRVINKAVKKTTGG